MLEVDHIRTYMHLQTPKRLGPSSPAGGEERTGNLSCPSTPLLLISPMPTFNYRFLSQATHVLSKLSTWLVSPLVWTYVSIFFSLSSLCSPPSCRVCKFFQGYPWSETMSINFVIFIILIFLKRVSLQNLWEFLNGVLGWLGNFDNPNVVRFGSSKNPDLTWPVSLNTVYLPESNPCHLNCFCLFKVPQNHPV